MVFSEPVCLFDVPLAKSLRIAACSARDTPGGTTTPFGAVWGVEPPGPVYPTSCGVVAPGPCGGVPFGGGVAPYSCPVAKAYATPHPPLEVSDLRFPARFGLA